MITRKKKVPATSQFKHSIDAHRVKVHQLQPAISTPIHYERHIPIKMSEDYSLSISIYRPENNEPPYPTVFYIPGTAFINDEFPFTALACSHIAKQSRCQVIVLRHRLAPEYPFPSALADIDHLLHGILQRADVFKINKNQLVIIGYSSGGNFSDAITTNTSFTHWHFQRQILISPILDLSRSLQAYKNDFENQDKVVPDNFVEWFLRFYLPKNISSKHPLISPSWNTIEHIKNSPPTDIAFGEYDRFRSDSEDYYLKLLRANVIAFRLMVNNADHSLFWINTTFMQAIGARIKVTLGLESVPRPLSCRAMLFFKQILNNSSRKNSSPEENRLVCYQK